MSNKVKTAFEAGKQKTSGSFSLASVVFLIFLVMKLMGWGTVASWSWWWVTAPLWGVFAIMGGLILLMLIFVGLSALFAGIVIGVSKIIEAVKNSK